VKILSDFDKIWCRPTRLTADKPDEILKSAIAVI